MSETQQVPESYREAVDEIATILDAIDDPDGDIDALGPRVERAAYLIQFCREKLSATEMRVAKALEGLSE